jgi:thiamine biosynthesis lipoprotein
MKKKDVLALIILFLVLSLAAYRYFNKVNSYEESRFMLDTIITLQLEDDEDNLAAVADSAFALIAKYQDELSFYGTGLLNKINKASTNDLPMDENIYQLLSIAKQLYQQTDGSYDVTIGSVSKLWDFNAKKSPSTDSIKAALQHVGFNKLKYDQNNLFKPQKIELNLGSLAKGFIVDKVVAFLQHKNIDKAIVNAGGDMRIYGYKDNIKVGIQHPRNRGDIIKILNMKNGAVVTSGDYERFFMEDGQRYHHILDAKTGYPSYQAVSVTVISEKAVWADALSTAIFLLPPAQAIKIIDALPNSEAIIFYKQNDEIKFKISRDMSNFLQQKGYNES